MFLAIFLTTYCWVILCKINKS